MATDAEITLKVTAEIQEALKAIRMLRDEIEKIKAAGGFLSPEDMELMEEMRGKLGDYTKQVRELQMEYYRLQKRSGEMSAEFISQVTTLRKQVEETQEQLSPLLKKIVDLQVEVNDLKEKTRQTGKEFTKSGEDGVRAYRSMRAMVRDFVVNLLKGKVAIGELATAMKGLMYSTAILAAIQAAMEGIRYVGTKIKEAFTENEEAAKNAAEALGNAEKSAMNAQAAIAATGEAMKDAAQERSLERQAAAIASSYKEQRDAAQATVEAINAQAKAEARRQALMAKMEDHEREMLKMQLKIDLLDEKITPEQYRKRLADLDVQQVQANAQRANEAARRNESGVQRTWSSAMEAQRVAGEEYARRKADLDKMTPADVIEAVEEQLKTVRKERDELRKQLDEATEKGLSQETLDELYQKWNEAADQAGELYDQLQRMGNTKEEYAFAKKNAEEALKNFQAAEQAFKRAEAAWNEAHGNTLATQEEGRVDVTQAEQRRDKTNALIDAEDRSNKRKKNEQQQKKDANAKEKAKQRRQEMERLAADIAEQAQIAAGTSKDTDDKAVLDKIRKAKEKYGAVFDKVLAQQNGIVSAVEMLQANTDRNERTLKELQGRIDKLIKQGKVQDTRSRKRSSL